MKRISTLFLIIYIFILFYTTFCYGTDLGVTLPEGITPKQIIKTIAPNTNDSLATLVGLKKWPYRPNTYIAIACFSPNFDKYENYFLYSQEKKECNCSGGSGKEFLDDYIPKQVFLSMVEYVDTLKVLASYEKALDIKVTWENSPVGFPGLGKDESDSIVPNIYEEFDFAKYQICENQIAFGINVLWTIGYPCGGGHFKALLLFANINGKIVNIFSEPIYSYQTWSCPFDEVSIRNVLVILKTKTNGYYDILIKELGGKWKKRFVWNPDKNRYLPLK